jgi:hypothetical protein
VKYLELVEERDEWETPMRTRLAFPTDEQVEAVQPWIDVDPAIDPNEWHMAQAYNARQALEAVRQTMIGDQ